MCQSKFAVLGYSTLSAYSKKFYILKTIVSFFWRNFFFLQFTVHSKTDHAVSYRFHSPRQRWDWIMVMLLYHLCKKTYQTLRKNNFFSNYQEIKIAYKTKSDNRLFFTFTNKRTTLMLLTSCWRIPWNHCVKTVLLAKPTVPWYFAKPIICFYKYKARFRVQFLRNLNERHSIYICIHS